MQPWLLEIIDKFSNSAVDEMVLNGCHSMLSQTGNVVTQEPSPFACALEFQEQLQEFAATQNIRLDPFAPIAGGLFAAPDWTMRWQGVIAPACLEGPLFILRRHRFATLGLDHFGVSPADLRKIQNLSADDVALLICGATGSGKTSFLACLLRELYIQQRVVIIEEYPELPLQSPTWIRLVGRHHDINGRGELRLNHLFEASLRLRPDRLVVGEIRGPEGAVFLEALGTGHGGCWATFHAGSCADVRNRFRMIFQRTHGGGSLGANVFRSLDNLWGVFLSRDPHPRLVSIEPLPSF